MPIALFLLLLILLPFARADELRQDPTVLVQQAESFLRTQTSSLPGEVRITVAPPDPRLTLAACAAAPQGFLPGNSRLWGNTLIGMRCGAPKTWTVYLQAHIAVFGNYVVSTANLHQGQLIQISQLTMVKGELTQLPADTLTDPEQAQGKQLMAGLPAGAALRASMLRSQSAVEQGQPVTVLSRGQGFEIEATGHAITTAQAGHLVEVKVENGQIVSGIADAHGIVHIDY